MSSPYSTKVSSASCGYVRNVNSDSWSFFTFVAQFAHFVWIEGLGGWLKDLEEETLVIWACFGLLSKRERKGFKGVVMGRKYTLHTF